MRNLGIVLTSSLPRYGDPLGGNARSRNVKSRKIILSVPYKERTEVFKFRVISYLFCTPFAPGLLVVIGWRIYR